MKTKESTNPLIMSACGLVCDQYPGIMLFIVTLRRHGDTALFVPLFIRHVFTERSLGARHWHDSRAGGVNLLSCEKQREGVQLI